ncbi:MAG: hypothetical protein M3O34_10560, partial [Chloroflexota bacterium]|nr:hypothetical protein [Chloroflexota bacterium]
MEVRLLFGDKSQTRTTDADGKYRFADLLASKYTLKVAAPAGFRVAGDATVGVTLDGKRDLTVDFKLLPVAPPTPVLSMSPPGAASQGAAAPSTAQQGALPG